MSSPADESPLDGFERSLRQAVDRQHSPAVLDDQSGMDDAELVYLTPHLGFVRGVSVSGSGLCVSSRLHGSGGS